jgi:hypothetical protein
VLSEVIEFLSRRIEAPHEHEAAPKYRLCITGLDALPLTGIIRDDAIDGEHNCLAHQHSVPGAHLANRVDPITLSYQIPPVSDHRLAGNDTLVNRSLRRIADKWLSVALTKHH